MMQSRALWWARSISRPCRAFLALLLLLIGSGIAPVAHAATTASATITVSGTPLGVSTRYIGANTSLGMDLSRIPESGFNSLRLWNDMTDFEPQDDSSVYGSPTIDQIKADHNIAQSGLINWSTWDANFQSSRPFFDTVKADHIRLMMSLRSTGPNHGVGWLKNQPPKTAADWNEWWEHVFAEAYWLNVRNAYQVDDWEMFNEPDQCCQGWNGDTLQYEQYVQITSDALHFLYQHYLPGRTPHIYVSALSFPQAGGTNVPNAWQDDVLHWVGDDANAISYHVYATGSKFVEGSTIAHDQAIRAQRNHFPVWATEWGSYASNFSGPNCNSDIPCTVELLDDLILASLPGEHYLYGSEYYYWGKNSYGDSIFDQNGNPRPIYYALRMGMQALQGGKTTFQSQSSTSDLDAITTKDSAGNLFVLLTNLSGNAYTAGIDLSALAPGSYATTLSRYDANNLDTSAAGPAVVNGQVSLALPANGAALLSIASTGSGADVTAPSAPGKLTITGVTESQAHLSWSAATDNVGIDGYDIYANGAAIAGTPASITSAWLTDLRPATTYTFVVKARDPAGNASTSNAVTIITPPLPAGKYEAEDASFAGHVTRDFTGFSSYSGMGYAENFINAGDGISFNAHIATAGNYVIDAHYSNGTGLSQQVSLYVNGRKAATSVLVPVADGANWGERLETVALTKGDNTITYQLDPGDGHAFRLDYIEVQPATALRPLPPNVHVEAGAGQATVSWNRLPVPTPLRATGYEISWGTSSSALTSHLQVGDVGSATISGLTGGTRYYFSVQALNAYGESLVSPSRSVVPTAGSAPVKLLGTPFGTPSSTPFDTFYNAFDGDTSSYFEGTGNGAYAGIDLGAGNASVVSQIRFRARQNDSWFLYLLENGQFQGSNDQANWDTLYTITAMPAPDWNTVAVKSTTAYRYLRFLGGNGSDIGEIEFARPALP